MKFVEGRHIANHILNSTILNSKITCMEILADLDRSLQSGLIESQIFTSTE